MGLQTVGHGWVTNHTIWFRVSALSYDSYTAFHSSILKPRFHSHQQPLTEGCGVKTQSNTDTIEIYRIIRGYDEQLYALSICDNILSLLVLLRKLKASILYWKQLLGWPWLVPLYFMFLLGSAISLPHVTFSFTLLWAITLLLSFLEWDTLSPINILILLSPSPC